jgi:ATP-binding cassette subfamily C (CFTR/MRP) protein 1
MAHNTHSIDLASKPNLLPAQNFMTRTSTLVSKPLLLVGQQLSQLLPAGASFKRIEEFLLCPERTVPVSGDDMEVEKETATGQAVVMNEHADGRIIMLDASFGVQNKVTLLRGLAVDLTHPPLWMVVVRVGCVSPFTDDSASYELMGVFSLGLWGKSTLLQSLLGELDSLAGSFSARLGTIGFCP